MYTAMANRALICLLTLLVSSSSIGYARQCALTASKRIVSELSDAEPSFQGKTARDWIQALNDKHDDILLQAINSLSEGGQAAISVLLVVLKDDKGVRIYAAVALGKMGNGVNDAVPALCLALWDKSPRVRVEAATAMSQLGPLPLTALPSLMQVLKDIDHWQPIEIWLTKILVQMGPEVIPALIVALRDQDVGVRERAAYVLGMMGAKAKPVIRALAKALQDKKSRRSAIFALERIGPDSIATLIAALFDNDNEIRWLAASALGRVGPAAKVAMGALTRATQHEDAKVRFYAAESLWKLEEKADVVVPVLASVLQAKTPILRYQAADVLCQIEPKAKSAIPNLVPALRDSYEWPGDQAAIALQEIGTDAVPVLLTALQDPAPQVRYRAIRAIGGIIPKLKDAIPKLLPLLEDHDAPVRLHTLIVLGEFGSDAQPAAPPLRHALKDSVAANRVHAARALWLVEGKPKNVVPALIEFLEHGPQQIDLDKNKYEVDNPTLIGCLRPSLPRTVAAETLGAMGRDAQAAVPGLIRSMADPDPEVRRQTVKALGQIGPDAAAAVPVLVKQLNDPFVKKQAVETLGMLRAYAKPAAPALAAVMIADIKKQVIGAKGWQALRAIDPSVHAKAEADAIEVLRKTQDDE